MRYHTYLIPQGMFRNDTSCSDHYLLNLKLTSRNWYINPLLGEGDTHCWNWKTDTIDGIGTLLYSNHWVHGIE